MRILAERQAAAEREARSAALAARARLASAGDSGSEAPDPGLGGSLGGDDAGGVSGEGVDGGGGGEIAPPPSGSGSGAADVALSQVGVPYLYGGESPSTGFDCSGLIVWAFRQVGIELPHSSYDLHAIGTPVSRDQLEPGDLVFFNGDGHAGIYLGDGMYVHSPQTGESVKVSSIDRPDYDGAVRI